MATGPGNYELVRRNSDGTYTTYEVVRYVSPGVVTDYSVDRQGYDTPPASNGWEALSSGVKLKPSSGCLLGSSTPSQTGHGSSLAGLNTFESKIGTDLSINHFYKRGAWTNGMDSERSMLERNGHKRCLAYYTWKVLPGVNFGAQLTGSNLTTLNSRIDQMVAQMKNEHAFYLSFYHEPENDIPGSGTAAQYVELVRHCWQRARSQGLDNAASVINYIGSVSNYALIPQLYPGDDVIDIIATDNYAHNQDNDLVDLLVETGGGGAWPGIYAWATTAKTLPASGTRPTGFSGTKRIMIGETGTDFAAPPPAAKGLVGGVSQAATLIGTIVSQLQSRFEQVDWFLWWNQELLASKGTDYRIQQAGREAAANALKAVAQSAYFNTVDTNLAP